MKLDAWTLRDAAQRLDHEPILRIFSQKYQQLAALADKEWLFAVSPFDPPGVLRLVTREGSFGWNGGNFFSDYRKSDRLMVRFAPDFHMPRPIYFK